MVLPCEFSNTSHATYTKGHTMAPSRECRRRSAATKMIWHAVAVRRQHSIAVSRVTKSLTKFYWALSKLPSTLVNTIGPHSDDPSDSADPDAELQHIVLRSYGLSNHQRMVKWLEHPGLGGTSNRS
jgi:hypothetical protein